MTKFFKSRMMRSMLPYFILALAIIVAFRLVSEFHFFTDAVGRFWGVMAPFLTGAVIAYIFNLPVCGIQRLLEKTGNRVVIRKSRIISVFIVLLITLVLFIALLNWVIPNIYRNVIEFTNDWSRHEQTIRGWVESINNWELPDFLEEFELDIDDLLMIVLETFQNLDFENFTGTIAAGFGGAFGALFHTFLAIVSAIYFLIETKRFKEFVVRLVAAVTSHRTNETILKYSRKLDFNFRQYIYVQTIDGIILGSIMTVVIFLFGSPHFLVLGLILGILNYIPYFGSIVGTAIAVIVIALTLGLPTAAVAAVVMFAIQQLDGNFIQPKLMGGSFSLSPLLVIISVTVGGHYGGVMGMLVAIPIVAILKDMLDTYMAYRERKKLEAPLANHDDFMNRDIW